MKKASILAIKPKTFAINPNISPINQQHPYSHKIIFEIKQLNAR